MLKSSVTHRSTHNSTVLLLGKVLLDHHLARRSVLRHRESLCTQRGHILKHVFILGAYLTVKIITIIHGNFYSIVSTSFIMVQFIDDLFMVSLLFACRLCSTA